MAADSITLSYPAHRLAALGLAGPLSTALAKYPAAPLEFDDGDPWATPLMLAAGNGRADCVAILLPLSDPLVVDQDGFSALMLAAAKGHADCISLLLPVSNPLATSSHGRDALMIAAGLPGPEALDCCKALLPASNPLASNYQEKTALIFAAQAQSLQVVELLAPVSNPRHASASGETALLAAAAGRSVDIVAALAPLSDCFALDANGHDAIAVAAGFRRASLIPAIIDACAGIPGLDLSMRRAVKVCASINETLSCSAILNSALETLPRAGAIEIFSWAAECFENKPFRQQAAAAAQALRDQMELSDSLTPEPGAKPRPSSMRL